MIHLMQKHVLLGHIYWHWRYVNTNVFYTLIHLCVRVPHLAYLPPVTHSSHTPPLILQPPRICVPPLVSHSLPRALLLLHYRARRSLAPTRPPRCSEYQVPLGGCARHWLAEAEGSWDPPASPVVAVSLTHSVARSQLALIRSRGSCQGARGSQSCARLRGPVIGDQGGSAWPLGALAWEVGGRLAHCPGSVTSSTCQL